MCWIGGEGQTYCHTHSNSLINKMDNSLLVVRGINHKYIVVGGERNISSITCHVYYCVIKAK